MLICASGGELWEREITPETKYTLFSFLTSTCSHIQKASSNSLPCVINSFSSVPAVAASRSKLCL